MFRAVWGDGPRSTGGRPFLGIAYHVTGQLRAVAAPRDQVQDAPGDDQINHQRPFQALKSPQWQRLDPAARFPDSEKNLNQPVFSIPINELNHILQGFRRPVGQQPPDQCRLSGRRLPLARQQRGHRRGRLPVMGRQRHRLAVQSLAHQTAG